MSTVQVRLPYVRARLVSAVSNGHAPVQVIRGVWICLRCELATTLSEHSPVVTTRCSEAP